MSDSGNPATAAILTLGCKLNIADSEVIARRLRKAGWNVVDRATAADAVVVNSCSVTHVADQKSRHLVRLARRLAPEATIALTGCLLETAPPDKIAELRVDLVFRQTDQLALADRLIELHPGEARALMPEAREEGPQRPALKTRAFLSAQEGCNDVCAFCIIPRTRGRERSKSVAWLVEEAQRREAEGVKEVVITGTQLGHYGRDLQTNLYDLLGALLRETQIPRIRMSSVQPQDLSNDLLGLWTDPRLCRHFHLALQSGSEAVLQRMRRRYSKQQYREAVMRLRRAVPGVAITTDVIVGFPGETAEEFAESYAFCEEMAFAGIHVFPYSQRAGTSAYKMPQQITDAEKKARVHSLIALAGEMSLHYRRSMVGTSTPVLWETRREDETWEGLTDTYVRVKAPSREALTNRLTLARIREVGDDGVLAEVIL